VATAGRLAAPATAVPAAARVCRLHRGDRAAAPRPAGHHLGDGAAPISRIADEVGWSRRHLIARFRQQVGLTPKIGARLVRLDAVWRHIEKRGPLDWGQVAADAGYADQAHLIRDFRQFTGTTPAEFLARTLPA